MLQERVAVRYTRALYAYAKTKGTLEAVMTDQKDMLTLLDQSRELELFLASPILSDATKRGIVKKLFDGRVHPDTEQFYEYLTERGREEMIPYIAREFVHQYNHEHNILLARVLSATPLTDAQRASLKTKLERQTGATIELQATVDPKLIGGVVVQVEDLRIDQSVAGALARARQQLAQTL